ncbi:hypothetical protein BKA62DRAFT_753627 [Auriculariales sp. MPI-PUGE-AT-0066]|nr:hypothetical protein BKA62DRAFT_753627 [Auriculariales sp. MPI-PUGE-AT-0066]
MVFRARMIFVARRRLDAADAVDALRLRRPSAPRPSVTSIRDTGVGARQGVYHQTDATRGTRWTHFGCVDRRRRALRLHPSEIPVWVHARVSITRPTRRRGRGGRTSAASTTNAARFRYIHPRYRCGCTPGCLSPGRRDAGDALDALRLRRPPTPRDPSVTSIRDTGVGARQGVYHQTDATRGTRWTHFCVDRRRRAFGYIHRDTGVGARQGIYTGRRDAGTRWTHFGCVDHNAARFPYDRRDAGDAVDALRCGCTPGCLSPDRRDAGTRWTHFGCVDHQRRAIPLHPSEIPVWVHARVSITRPTRRGDAVDALRLRRPSAPRPSVTSIRDTGVGARQGVYYQIDATRRTRWTRAASTTNAARFPYVHPRSGVGARQGVYYQVDTTRQTRWTHFGLLDRCDGSDAAGTIPLHRNDVFFFAVAVDVVTQPHSSCLCNALIAAVAPRQPQRHACDECDGVAGATVDATATLSHPPLPLHRVVGALRLDDATHSQA